MEKQSVLSYVKQVIKEQPTPPRQSDFSHLARLAFKSLRGAVFWGMGAVFVLSGIGIFFTLVSVQTTLLGALMAFFGVGLIGYLYYFSYKIHSALESGIACLIPSSRMEQLAGGRLPPAEAVEFQLKENGDDINMNLKEGDKVLALLEPQTNRVLAKFNMIWEMSG